MAANIHNEAITTRSNSIFILYNMCVFFSIIIKKVIFSMEATAAATATAATDSKMLDGWNRDNRFVLSAFKGMKTCDSPSCNSTKDNDAMTHSNIHIPPLPSTDASSSDILLSTVSKETTPTLEDIPSELFIRHILPFVGHRQYRFVAAVNRNFHTAYVTVFPKKLTCVNVSTIEHAKICFDENKRKHYHQRMLCRTAARKGNLTVLKYLRSIQCSWYSDTCAFAAGNGHLDVIKWCRENGGAWDSWTCAAAAEKGHLDVIKWCRQNGCEWDEYTCKYAAANGHIDTLKWCRQNGCLLDTWTCGNAAKNGHLDVVKWLREIGYPWHENTCANAAEYGHLDVVKWCRQNGCPWDKYTCFKAAENGHLDVIKWCHENGCPWNEWICASAARNGHLDIVKWCRENGLSMR
jgi:hypothetical protein